MLSLVSCMLLRPVQVTNMKVLYIIKQVVELMINRVLQMLKVNQLNNLDKKYTNLEEVRLMLLIIIVFYYGK